jgi:hypothetical protein
MIHHFDHRWASFSTSDHQKINEESKKKEPHFVAKGRYWVKYEEVKNKLNAVGWNKKWLLGIRDITNATNTRTLLGTVFPISSVGDTINILFSKTNNFLSFISILSTFILDYIVRLKLGGIHLNHFIVKQLPILPPNIFDLVCLWSPNETYLQWLMKRIIELTYTAYDLEAFADDCGYSGPPFKWDTARRFLLRCELDAAFFHLYLNLTSEGKWQKGSKESHEDFTELTTEFLTPRDAVAYVMETFSSIKEQDIKLTGKYLTKITILEIYDQMLEAMAKGGPYLTKLDPPPAAPYFRHKPKNSGLLDFLT